MNPLFVASVALGSCTGIELASRPAPLPRRQMIETLECASTPPYNTDCISTNPSNCDCAALITAEKQIILDLHNTRRDWVAGGQAECASGNCPPATNMNYLLWDTGLESISTFWAHQCIDGHQSDYAATAYSRYYQQSNDILDNTHPSIMYEDQCDDANCLSTNYQANTDGDTSTSSSSPDSSSTASTDASTFDVGSISNTSLIGENIGAKLDLSGYSMTDILSSINAWYDESKFYDWNRASAVGGSVDNWRQGVWAKSRYVGCGYAICPASVENPFNQSSNAWLNFVCEYYPSALDNDQDPYIAATVQRRRRRLQQSGTTCSECDDDSSACVSGSSNDGQSALCGGHRCSACAADFGQETCTYTPTTCPSNGGVVLSDDGTGRPLSATGAPTLAPTTNTQSPTLVPTQQPSLQRTTAQPTTEPTAATTSTTTTLQPTTMSPTTAQPSTNGPTAAITSTTTTTADSSDDSNGCDNITSVVASGWNYAPRNGIYNLTGMTNGKPVYSNGEYFLYYNSQRTKYLLSHDIAHHDSYDACDIDPATDDITGCTVGHWRHGDSASVDVHTCITLNPTPQPTAIPTVSPTPEPTDDPTPEPTDHPTSDPTIDPTIDPTTDPTVDPTIDPTTDPTIDPTVDPTIDPTVDPTTDPTNDPTADPTVDPTDDPTVDPTIDPTVDPTSDPSMDPTIDPTVDPTNDPTADPTVDPTTIPTLNPTNNPTEIPTVNPTKDPTIDPTTAPSLSPSLTPTHSPSMTPTGAPSFPPTNAPTAAPSFSPTLAPSFSPSMAPTNAPSFSPSNYPTMSPSNAPTNFPTASPSDSSEGGSSESSESNDAMSIMTVQSFNMRVDADYDEMRTAYPDMNGWAVRVVQSLYHMDGNDSEDDIVIINGLMRGSVIIDYTLQSKDEQQMEAWIAGMNDTVSVQVDNRTFNVLSNQLNDGDSENVDVGKVKNKYAMLVFCSVAFGAGVLLFLCCYGVKTFYDKKYGITQPMMNFMDPTTETCRQEMEMGRGNGNGNGQTNGIDVIYNYGDESVEEKDIEGGGGTVPYKE